MTWHESLRADLTAALRSAGPDAPTLCEGWRTRHLAAHVVLRERSVKVGLGLVVRPLANSAEHAIQELAAGAESPEGYTALVGQVAAGPSRWHPVAWAPDAANTTELWVHTQDVLRGDGARPASPAPELDDELWRQVERASRLSLRGVPTGVVLVRDGGERRRARAPHGENGTVVVRGGAGELLLWLNGRGAAAGVTFEGPTPDVAALAARLPV
ncbi:TIGR03085 family metal-binding protein [Cellulomonas composti]|uniref:TIGR03085 family protein n=1 Tax=Cellulomonas composti TaxID=266130 RepID=A0A511J639_9CELL|nr:TIGR03085 family metal-binding protein [Cellulomonas composti]GEL93454.1 TIGR03085 family protein [Cellulomonas composti]